MKQGYVQVYTGDGKGKTTASFGLALRAVGAGLKVYIGQFMKGMDYSELKSASLLPNLVVEQYGTPQFIHSEPTQRDIEKANEGLTKIEHIIQSCEYDIVIMEEINVALMYGLFSTERVLDIIKNKPQSVELVLTGRYAKKEIIETADLVTEMRLIKHYFNDGVNARKGIEM
ncbi:MAG: cob(I)yrinic acid a,c-diamide adenosyltransferase [Spirochaetaceae bacterium]|nr:cob(I)yrinic acid a,c-diamide adenosyltransferase [Spirochaetaceae bacterium]